MFCTLINESTFCSSLGTSLLRLITNHNVSQEREGGNNVSIPDNSGPFSIQLRTSQERFDGSWSRDGLWALAIGMSELLCSDTPGFHEPYEALSPNKSQTCLFDAQSPPTRPMLMRPRTPRSEGRSVANICDSQASLKVKLNRTKLDDRPRPRATMGPKHGYLADVMLL